jgi:hypothetical protein
MATMLPKVLEIERHQLADYARVDYAITKGEDEVAALEELCLEPNELRREASVVRDRTVLAVREVRNNMAKRAITAKNMQRSLVESLRQRSRFAVVDTVDASLRARCFANLECIPTLTLVCHFIDAEAVHRHDAAAPSVGIPKRRQVAHSLIFGVDRLSTTRRVLAPIRDQAPVQWVERYLSALVIAADH